MGKEEGKKKGGCLKVGAILFAVALVLSFLGFGDGGEEGVQTVETATIEELTELRDEALKIKEYGCADGTYDAVLASFNDVQNVLNHPDEATDEDIANAYNIMVEAMNQVVDIHDAEKNEANAVIMARYYAASESGAFSRAGTINSMVIVEEYSRELAEYGVDNAGIDWKEEAFERAMSYIEWHPAATYQEVAEHVLEAKYTTEEVAYALVMAGFAV